eukprot:CAMPEP_0171102422 /NCGR_PEP_ID=MMETSP0766_2-20121228/57779_1 /TAXON_ID=439317 /ORGANISM="Gambierdiscus australes, Strain CAWD 149" /LENGTH=442 /DNA_ID=CAMNT_0011562715 /DNA_START=57 /DNA_END=1385 /DNA_ORIENTATION=-
MTASAATAQGTARSTAQGTEVLEGTAEEPLEGTIPYHFDGTQLDTHILGARPKARLSEEERLAREVARRRQVEIERRARIFDAKRRTIGVDVEALEAQKADNEQRRQQARAEDRAYERQLLQHNQMLTQYELEKQRNRRAAETSCKDFSMKNLHFESRREFDLNDPAGHRKVPPTRVGDEDPRLGPASMQKFSGEDITREERKRQQQLETVSFIEQQKFEKTLLSKAEAEEDRQFAHETAAVTQVRNRMEEDEAKVRQSMLKTEQDANLQLAEENARLRKQRILEEQALNERELDFHSKDPFLNELGSRSGPVDGSTSDLEGTAGEGGAVGHVSGNAYKGSTRAERVANAKALLLQAEEDYHRKDYHRVEDHIFAGHQEQTRKKMLAMEREKARMKRAMAEQVARENRVLHLEQKTNNKRLDTLHTNEYRPEFFEQFGTSCR